MVGSLSCLREFCVGRIMNAGLLELAQRCPTLETVECFVYDALLPGTLHTISTNWLNLRNFNVWLKDIRAWRCEHMFLLFLRSLRTLQRVRIESFEWKTELTDLCEEVVAAALRVPVPTGGISVIDLHAPVLREAAVVELAACSPRLRAVGFSQPVSATVVQAIASTAVVGVTLSALTQNGSELHALHDLHHLNLRAICSYKDVPSAAVQVAQRSPLLHTLWMNFCGQPKLDALLKITRACPKLQRVKYRDRIEDEPVDRDRDKWDSDLEGRITDRAVQALHTLMRERCPKLHELLL
jgi:hypothetical protein